MFSKDTTAAVTMFDGVRIFPGGATTENGHFFQDCKKKPNGMASSEPPEDRYADLVRNYNCGKFYYLCKSEWLNGLRHCLLFAGLWV